MIHISAREMDERLAAARAEGVREGILYGLESAALRIETYATISAKLIEGTGIPELHAFLAKSVREMKEQVKE